MSNQTQTSIVSMFSSLLFLLAGIPAVAAIFPAGFFDYLTAHLSGFVGALSIIMTAIIGAFKMWPASAAKKVALAGELPQVSRIVTTPAIASAPAVKRLVDSRAYSPTVVTHDIAMTSPPPKPTND